MATDVDIPQTAVAPSADHERLFRFSAWLHVGEGADECDHRESGECTDPGHFHGWCRLPNKLQQREIRDHGLAARARKARQLRSPDTSGYEILEGGLDALARRGDDAREDLIAELLQADWARDYLAALAEVKTSVTDDEDEQLVWEHVDDDQARWKQLQTDLAKHPQLADSDEYKELETRLLAYQDAIDTAFEAVRAPRRAELEPLDISALLDRVRDLRIDAASQEDFLHTYAIWEWATCTRTAPAGPALWSEPADLTDLPDEVLGGLERTYDELEKAQREDGSPGNS